MTTLLWQFQEPHVLWDELTDWLDSQYAAECEGRTCLDCRRCAEADAVVRQAVGATGRFGLCSESGEFVTVQDTPQLHGCMCFEVRS